MSEHEHLHDEEHCGCGCGHDHEHEHTHEDHHEHHHEHHHDHDDDECGCGCGHDHHDHEHDEREHHHDHHHDHDDDECSCGCGHDHHDHEHDEHEQHHEHHHHDHDDDECGCGCGHDHHEHEHDEHEHLHEHHHHDHNDDECGCGCGHDHHEHEHDEHKHLHEHHHHDHNDDECGCGCGHDHHEHEHDEHEHHHEHQHHDHNDDGCGCGCGHDHHEHEHHHHDHIDECGCGHEHGHDHHHEHEEHEHHHHAAGPEKQVFILENLGCANCAAKMERRINELDDVADATITFATKQLRISGTHLDALVPQIQEICASIESEVKVVPKTPVTKNGGDSRVYILENLGCANCAAKMERRINELDDVTDATITFATKQLRITGKRLDSLLPQIQDICASIESEVKVVPKDPAPKAAVKAEDKTDEKAEQRKTLAMIAAGAVLFIIGEVMEHTGVNGYAPAIVNVIAYLILGLEIVITAVKNLTHGQVFDENFLMSIATLGAFAVGDFSEAVGVMLFYRIGEFFEDIAVERSRNQIMDAVDLRPETVNLVSGNDIRVIPAEETEVGDVLLVRPGDRIPLDGTILEGDSRLDTSAITGEPVPVTVKKGDEIVSGCVNVSGQLKIRVDKPLSESMVTRILDSVENAAASKPKIDRFITRFARVYTPFVVVLALATAIIPSLVSGNWYYWVHTALTFLVISCPCALVLSVPLAFFSGIGAGSKKGILFKGGISLEQLHNVKAVVMDKTGTITEGNFVVQEVVSTGSLSSDELLTLAAGCEQISTHPIATSIVTAAQEKGLSLVKPAKLEEIAGHGISAETTNGTLLVGNRKLMDQFHIDLSAYQKKGFGSEVLIALNGKFEGHIVISDTIKSEAKSAIAALKKLGITTAMLTGDAQESADAVAAATGADAAIEAADVVFMNSNMDAIPQAIRIANATSAISWQNVVFALIIKAIVMILGLTGHASMWFAVFADTGVAMLCILNSIRILYKK